MANLSINLLHVADVAGPTQQRSVSDLHCHIGLINVHRSVLPVPIVV